MKAEQMDYKDALRLTLLGWADDELILGHRNSEWCGHAPILEEDIAFANIALDELGHAILWYQACVRLEGGDPETGADRLVYQRKADQFRCVRLVELPNRDWAFTIVRQFLFDTYEAVLLDALQGSAYGPVAEIAAKVRPEELYHRRHGEAWVRRLGLGTAESNQKMQTALAALWPFSAQLFLNTPEWKELARAGVVPSSDALADEWQEALLPILREADLVVPGDSHPSTAPRTSHSDDFGALVTELQSVASADAGAIW